MSNGEPGSENGSEDQEDEPEREEPIGVGDDRKKYVEVLTRSGERTEHFESYLRHTTEAFLVSPEDTFPSARTTRYAKADLLRVEIAQQHSTCFITTATVGASETLDSLREFREEVLRRSRSGRALLGVYDRVSPPIARTLSEHPGARTTRVVRRLVEYSSALARRRQARTVGSYRSALALALVCLYAVGLWCALVGHAAIRSREAIVGLESTDAPF